MKIDSFKYQCRFSNYMGLSNYMEEGYFFKVDFDEIKKLLNLEKRIESEWIEQPNGVLVKPYISEEESIAKNLTYVGLKFEKRTDGHKYRTQTDTILFVNPGMIEFMKKDGGLHPIPFSAGDAIQISPSVTRKIIPFHQYKPLEIELIVIPRFKIEDEIHVYD